MFWSMCLSVLLSSIFSRMFKERTLSGTLDLKDNFNSGDIVRMGNNFDEILAGLTMQPSETYDTNFVDDVNIFSFRPQWI